MKYLLEYDIYNFDFQSFIIYKLYFLYIVLRDTFISYVKIIICLLLIVT